MISLEKELHIELWQSQDEKRSSIALLIDLTLLSHLFFHVCFNVHLKKNNVPLKKSRWSWKLFHCKTFNISKYY